MGYIEDIKSCIQWGNSFERQDRFPLDRTSIHSSYEDAVKYAKGDGTDARGLGKIAYIGQMISVWGPNEYNNEGTWIYALSEHKKTDAFDTTLADLQPINSSEGILLSKAIKKDDKELYAACLSVHSVLEDLRSRIDNLSVGALSITAGRGIKIDGDVVSVDLPALIAAGSALSLNEDNKLTLTWNKF